jgi:hypothetical protein
MTQISQPTTSKKFLRTHLIFLHMRCQNKIFSLGRILGVGIQITPRYQVLTF